MTQRISSTTAAVLGLLTQTHARITDTGLWDGNDWYDDGVQIGVASGVPYSDDSDVRRRIEAPLALEGSVPDYMTFDNVQRVMRLFPETDYDFVVPERNALYTYDGLMRAIGKFPAFCGESNLDGYDLDETCKRELATLFAHFNQETGQHDTSKSLPEWRQGLWHITEWACTPPQWGTGTASCDYKTGAGSWATDEYPPQADEQYYGRGPFQLSWNYNYGAFSEVLVESTYDSRMYLLNNPDQVHQDAFTVFTSALWFYMTPQSPKPSIHDVATGFMIPTAADTSAGFGANFGVTTNIINGGQECGGGWENSKSESRISYYTEFLNYFDLPAEDRDTMTCGNLSSSFPTGGYGDAFAYFDQGWNGDAECIPVKWQTPYTVYTRDDYKRCICDYFGDGEADCPQAEDDGDNDDHEEDDSDNEEVESESDNEQEEEEDEEDDDNEEENPIVVSDPAAEFQEIWDNPHFNDAEPSRTMFQVDRSLDYIERKLTEIHAVFEAKQLI